VLHQCDDADADTSSLRGSITIMGAETDYRQLLSEMRKARELLRDRAAGMKDFEDKYQTLEESANELYKRAGRLAAAVTTMTAALNVMPRR